MTENQLATIAVNTCYSIHKQLGPGLLESVYEEILTFELINRGIYVERQKPIPLVWKNKALELSFRADLILNNKLILELKSVEVLAPVHYKQLLTYLKLTNLKLGLLINFNSALIKEGINRVVLGL